MKYFFFKILQFTICFLFLYYIWHFIFNFVYLYLSKNSTNFYNFLFCGFLEILSKNFGKSWNIFQRNIDIRNPKFFKNFIVSYLFFLFFYHFGNVFFLFHLSRLVKKFYTFFLCFIVRIIDFIREFWKILEFLLKK